MMIERLDVAFVCRWRGIKPTFLAKRCETPASNFSRGRGSGLSGHDAGLPGYDAGITSYTRPEHAIIVEQY